MPSDNAKRVVEGAQRLSPHLGHRMLAAKIRGKPVFLRELLPQDLKLDLEHLSQEEAMEVAGYLGNVVGRSHAAQMESADRKKWLGELGRNRSKTIEAPSWLWLSVVDLVQAHEGAYLEHCRRFANVEA